MHAQSHSAVIDVPADAVFGVLTDLDCLPNWNEAIVEVTERPARLAPDAEWVVRMRALGQTWLSRARVLEHDPATRRLRYRSCTDDGNPSWAEWTWTVVPVGESRSQVTVSWALHPMSFWRRVLLVRIRARQLRRAEIPRSLAQLARAAAAAKAQ